MHSLGVVVGQLRARLPPSPTNSACVLFGPSQTRARGLGRGKGKPLACSHRPTKHHPSRVATVVSWCLCLTRTDNDLMPSRDRPPQPKVDPHIRTLLAQLMLRLRIPRSGPFSSSAVVRTSVIQPVPVVVLEALADP